MANSCAVYITNCFERMDLLPRRCSYSDSIVVLIYLFSVLSYRSMRWAFEKRNWPLWMRHLRRPSYSQLMRRLHSRSSQECMARIRDAIPTCPAPCPQKYLDGKPLVVGAHSKDKEARRGYVGRDTWARGYKLHAVVNAAGLVENMMVTPLHEGEATMAKRLLEQVKLHGVTLLADANYNSNALYETVANGGGRLLAPRRKPGRGLGKRSHHAHRLEAIAKLETVPGAMQQHKADRNRAEQAFAIWLTVMKYCANSNSVTVTNLKELRTMTLWSNGYTSSAYCALLAFSLGAFCAYSEEPSQNASSKLVISSDNVTQTRMRPRVTRLKWNGQDYDVESGIHVLSGLVQDSMVDSKQRVLALQELSTLREHLRGRLILDDLAKRYDSASDLEKLSILLCFKTSDDPRGIPLYLRALEREHNLKLRLRAAKGLADWNVRQGVSELIKLLDSPDEMPQPSQLFYVRDNAMQSFRLANIQKGWGFPDDKESVEWPPDVMPPPEVAARLKPPPTTEEIKKWWVENQHRFPEWKPGDPLPAIESPQPRNEGK